jgi:hypothetical protein
MRKIFVFLAVATMFMFSSLAMAQDLSTQNYGCSDTTSYILYGDMGEQNMIGSHNECGMGEDKWKASCKYLPKAVVVDSVTGRKRVRQAGCYVCYSDFTNMKVNEVAQAVISFNQTYAANTDGRVFWPKERDVFDWSWCSVCPR